MRGTTHRISDCTGVPLIKGEKIISAGLAAAKVALSIDITPKEAPRIPPNNGPIVTAPIITGICMIVMEIGGIMIKPNGVKVRIAWMAISMASCARRIVLARVFFFNLYSSLLLLSPKEDAAQNLAKKY